MIYFFEEDVMMMMGTNDDEGRLNAALAATDDGASLEMFVVRDQRRYMVGRN